MVKLSTARMQRSLLHDDATRPADRLGPSTVRLPDTHPHRTAKALSYTCDDGCTVQAVYPDADTAVLTLDRHTHRLHTAISADGARYVGDQWQWWTKGMHDARLAPLQSGETVASASGVSCTAP